MPRIIVNTEVCKGCELCAAACPRNLIGYEKDKINSKGYHPATVSDMSQCIACASCARMCPDSVITVEKE